MLSVEDDQNTWIRKQNAVLWLVRWLLASGQTGHRPTDSCKPCEEKRQWANAANSSRPVVRIYTALILSDFRTSGIWRRSVTGNQLRIACVVCTLVAVRACYTCLVHAAWSVFQLAGRAYKEQYLQPDGEHAFHTPDAAARGDGLHSSPTWWLIKRLRVSGLVAVCTMSYTFSRSTIIVWKILYRDIS